MTKHSKEKREIWIGFRLTKGELKAIDDMAQKAGKGRSELLRSVVHSSLENNLKPEELQRVA